MLKIIKIKRYTKEDFLDVRDFLIVTFHDFQRPFNWTIERWNFSIMARSMNGISEKQWLDEVGIIEDLGEIIAIINSEGEGRGEAFFQVKNMNMSKEIYNKMFKFAEDNISIKKGNGNYLAVRIPEIDTKRKEVAEKRNYFFNNKTEKISELILSEKLNLNLKEGYKIKNGDQIECHQKAAAHGRAFGYFDEELYLKRAEDGYKKLMKMPDYNPETDLYLLYKDEKILSFCTLWYDAVNKIGILEPAGSIPGARNKGFARTVIYEAINRVKKRGAQKIFVGSSQEFYQKLGFKVKYKFNIWEKYF